MSAPAPVLSEVVVADEPEAWAAAGFHVDGDRVVVGEVAVRLVGRGDGRKRIVAWGFAGLDAHAGAPVTEIDGLPTAEAATPAPPTADHPNGVVALDHIVVLSPDDGRTTAALEAVGLAARRTRETDTYGAPMRQTFFRSGDTILELIGPDQPSGDGPAGFFGLAWTVHDLDATAALLGTALGTVKDAVQPGRRIATLRHRDVGLSVATAFMSAP